MSSEWKQHDAPQISAKTGLNVDQVLEQIVDENPGSEREIRRLPCRRLIFDSLYDSYKGVIVFLSVSKKVRFVSRYANQNDGDRGYGRCGGSQDILAQVSLSLAKN